jgi:hypothetical protein
MRSWLDGSNPGKAVEHCMAFSFEERPLALYRSVCVCVLVSLLELERQDDMLSRSCVAAISLVVVNITPNETLTCQKVPSPLLLG